MARVSGVTGPHSQPETRAWTKRPCIRQWGTPRLRLWQRHKLDPFFSLGLCRASPGACFRLLAETSLEWCLCYLCGWGLSVKIASCKLALSKAKHLIKGSYPCSATRLSSDSLHHGETTGRV